MSMSNDLNFLKKPKGLIICGYPGIGKSSVAGYRNTIDLESSDFSQKAKNLNDKSWVEQYCWMAMRLASQGYTVLTSTHKEVIEYFKISDRSLKAMAIAGPVIFCPTRVMKEDWGNRLKNRYSRDPSDKNWRACDRCEKNYLEDIVYLYNCGLPVVYPEASDYDLRDYIYYMQNKFIGENYKAFEDVLWDLIRQEFSVTFMNDLPSGLCLNGLRIRLRKKNMVVEHITPYELIFDSNLNRDEVMKLELLEVKKRFDHSMTKRKEEPNDKLDQ